MSEDLLFAKISEPEMTVINFDDHFRDRMGEVERGHIEVFPKPWNLRPYDKTNGEMTRVPHLTAAYHKGREETKDWGDYEKLPEEIPEFPLIRRKFLGAVSVVQTPILRAIETNERRIEKFVGTMDPYFVGRNAAVLQYTRLSYTDQATRRRISNAATPKPGGFDKEWARLDLAPMKMRGRTELPEASLILTSVKPELTVGGTLQTRTFLAPFGCEEIKVVHGEEEDESAGILIIPKFPEWAESEKQGPSSSKKDASEGDDGQGGSRRTEEPMQQGNDQAEREDDKASTGGISSLDFNFFSDFENNADTLEAAEPADEGTSTMEPPSAFMEMKRNLPESSSPGNSKSNEQRLFMESPRRKRLEGAARVPFMEGYLETMLQCTTLKQKAYGTLASSEMQAETIEQLVSLPWKAVVLRYFEEEMRTTPKIHALMAVPYVRTELQLRFAWCMMGLTRGEYDSEERKKSKVKKVFLMTNLRDLIIQEGMAVACAKRRDALCFIRFLIEQISVAALNTCVKMLQEGDERAKALLLLALLDVHQSKPMRVNMKEPEELEPMRKIDEIRRFSNKELRLTKESMGALPKSSEYCGPIRKKSYSYVSKVIGIAYNPFLSEDIRDCFFDYEQAVLQRFWTSRIATIKSATNPQTKLGLVLEEKVDCTFRAKIRQTSGVWIAILR